MQMRSLRLNCLTTYFAIFVVVCFVTGCNNSRTPAQQSEKADNTKKQSAYPIQAQIDLGVLIQGESAVTHRWIKNSSEKPVTIAKVDKSCDCVDLVPAESEIAPNQRALAKITYDGAKEPDFVGSLQVELKLLESDGTQIGLVQIPIEVVKPETTKK